MNQDIKTTDTLSLQFYGVKVLQNLLKFHYNDSKPEAFIDADLARLHMVYSNSVNTLKDSLYLNALTKLQKTYESIPFVTEVNYLIDSFYITQSSYYNPDDSTS